MEIINESLLLLSDNIQYYAVVTELLYVISVPITFLYRDEH